MSSPGPATQEAGKESTPAADGRAEDRAGRFGPNSAEVSAFVAALERLTGAQWRKVVATRKLAAAVIRDPSALPAGAVRALLAGADSASGSSGPANGGAPTPEPVAALAAALAGPLEGRGDEELLAAWQAGSALARRRQMQAVTFAAHYVPFASVIPLVSVEPAPPAVDRFTKALRWMTAPQWRLLATQWTLDRENLAALLQAAVRTATREGEEAAALAALSVAPKHLDGDAGWSAVKTAVHGARVLAARAELSPEQVAALWWPLEEAIALRSLDDQPESEKPPRRVRATKAEVAKKPAARRGPPYGPNSADVALFVKTIPVLTAIQWLRINDRRQLVARIVRERSAEPAQVVRASVNAIRLTRGLDHEARCRVLSAVERAGYALESRAQLSPEQAREHYGPVGEVVPPAEVAAASFASRIAALNREEWVRLAEIAPPVDGAAVGPILSAGDAIADLLAERDDEEIAGAWNAMAALVHRHRLSPIKFAVSFAPFASVVNVVKPRSLPPLVQRYLTAAGRLSAHQCTLLAEPWLLADDVSSALSTATAGAAVRASEEAAALSALVTVPMRLTGDAGWAAAKTIAYGARVAAVRGSVTNEQFTELWKPVERAIPLASLEANPRSKS